MPPSSACFDSATIDVPFHDEGSRACDAARLGMILFIGAEIMFFAGFISAFIAFRAGAESWPPAGQPRLPVFITAINTAILIGSTIVMEKSLASIRLGRTRDLTKYLSLTAILGGTFLAIQGYEWVRLIGHGLSLSSSIYGAIFYTIIGTHGLHVAFAMAFVLVVLGRARSARYSAADHLGVELCAMYWYFVAWVWPILYGLVYWS